MHETNTLSNERDQARITVPYCGMLNSHRNNNKSTAAIGEAPKASELDAASGMSRRLFNLLLSCQWLGKLGSSLLDDVEGVHRGQMLVFD